MVRFEQGEASYNHCNGKSAKAAEPSKNKESLLYSNKAQVIASRHNGDTTEVGSRR